MPKEQIFYKLQHILAENQIYITAKTDSNPISLTLKNANVYYHGIKGVEFKKAVILPFILYNRVTVKEIKLPIGEYRIKKALITYSVADPFNVHIEAEADFAKITGIANLKKRYVKIYLLNLKSRDLRRFLRKDKKGYYYYEKY